MYEIAIYQMIGNNSEQWPKETKTFPSFEDFLIWDHNFHWQNYWHFGELIGKEEHENWYAHKYLGHWHLLNRTFEYPKDQETSCLITLEPKQREL